MSKKFRFDQVDYHELEVYADGYLNNSEAFRNLPSQIKEKLLEDLPPLEKNPLIYLDTTPKKILYREGLLKTKMPLFSGKNLKIILQEAPPISEAKELIIPSEITNQLDFQKYQNIINSKWKALGTYVWEDVLDFKYLSFKKQALLLRSINISETKGIGPSLPLNKKARDLKLYFEWDSETPELKLNGTTQNREEFIRIVETISKALFTKKRLEYFEYGPPEANRLLVAKKLDMIEGATPCHSRMLELF